MLARALGITAEEVEQAKEDGALTDLLADVSKDDLQTAYETTATEAIDEASTDGDITSTQADRLKEVVTADRSDLTDSDIETLKSLRGAIEVDRIAILASLLGKTSEEVETAKADGTLRDLLADVNRVALVAALVDARDAAIDAAEEAGDITAEQAELLRDTGAGFGGRMGRGPPWPLGQRLRQIRRLVGRQEGPHSRGRPGVAPPTPHAGRSGHAKGRPLGAPSACLTRRRDDATSPPRSRARCRA